MKTGLQGGIEAAGDGGLLIMNGISRSREKVNLEMTRFSEHPVKPQG